MKTILITGGAGFLGSFLCEALLMEGNKIICVDNLHTGKEENIHELKNKILLSSLIMILLMNSI